MLGELTGVVSEVVATATGAANQQATAPNVVLKVVK